VSANNTGFGDFVSGFLVGSLVGATVAFLAAPKSGEETREEIRAKGLELQGSTEQAMQEARKSLSAATADLNSRVEELRAQSQAVIDEGRKQWADAGRTFILVPNLLIALTVPQDIQRFHRALQP